MTYHVSDLRVEMKLSSVWTDVSADALYPIVGYEGIKGDSPLDRVASRGSMTFMLDNGKTNSAGLEGYYTPDHANVRAGFDIGTEVRLYVKFEGLERFRFFGRIEPNGIRPSPGTFDARVTTVIVSDWMSQAEKHEVTLPAFAENKNAAEVVALVVANMPIAPEGTDYQDCADTFEFVFDTLRDKTKATTEIIKAIVSEWGYCYIKHSSTSGEVLTVEGRGNRDPLTLTQLPLGNDEAGFLLKEDGDYLLLETGDKLILNQVQNASFDNQFVAQPPVLYGKNIFNRVSGRTYPRSIDADATTVLFELNDPIRIRKLRTKPSYRGRYRDPDGGNWMAGGRDMVTPVSGVDYICNTASDGSGADVTSDLSITASYGTEAVEYLLTNTSSDQALYITTLQARGRGVYIYDPVSSVLTDSDSQNLYGVLPINLDMKYQTSPDFADGMAASVLQYYKDPQASVMPPWFNCNSNDTAMYAFMSLDIGETVEFKDDQTAINGYFFVQGHSWRIDQGNIIYYSPVIVSVDNALVWILGVTGFSEVGQSTYLTEA